MEQTKKKGSIMTMIALMFCGFFCMADVFVVSPVVGEIAGTFPNAGTIAIDMTVSLSMLFILVGSFICIPLRTRMPKKTLLLIGTLLVIIFGGCGGMVYNLGYNLVFRALEGLGAGIGITLAPVMVGEFWEGNKLENIIGWQNALGCVLGAIASFLSGIIAVKAGWGKSYFIFFFFIIIFILIAVFVPKTEKEPVPAKEDRPKMNRASWGWILVAFIFGMCVNILFIKEGIYFEEVGIASAAAIAGTAQGLGQIGSFLGGLILGIFLKKLKTFSDPVMWLTFIIGLLIVLVGQGRVILIIGTFIFMFGNGILFPWLFAKVPSIAAKGTETATTAFVNALYSLGMFASGYVFSGLAIALGNDTAGFALKIDLIVVIIMTVIFLILGFTGLRKKKAA